MTNPIFKSPSFVVLEGVDGSGTTTQVELLAESLRARGNRVHVTREPTTGPVGRFLRTALEKKLVDETGQALRLDWAAMALLFAADRVDHLKREVEPKLAEGYVVLSDRFDLSSLLYQSLTSPLGAEALPWLKNINAQVRRPDLTLVLDLPAEMAAQRRALRGGEPELYEQSELQSRLVEGYRAAPTLLAQDRIHVLRATGSIAEVASQVLNKIEEISHHL